MYHSFLQSIFFFVLSEYMFKQNFAYLYGTIWYEIWIISNPRRDRIWQLML